MDAPINEDILWEAAEKLRNKCSPADYPNIVLGLVFLKYVSDKYQKKYEELKANNDGSEKDKNCYIADHVFTVPEKAQWDYVASFSKQANLGQKIEEAFILIEKENEKLKGLLPKIYSKSDLDLTTLGELVDFFTTQLNLKDVKGDFFGQVYEFYIGKFALEVPTKGGEYFTPKSLVELMVELLEPKKGRVYDPCCGSGGMFVQCSKFIQEFKGNIDSISIYGQEINPETWRMAKMNLAIHGIEGDLGQTYADSFTNDQHKNLKADFIIANPPYNVKKYWKSTLEGDERWVFGKPSDNNANYAWLSLMYSKLNNSGKAAILMPNGATTSNQKSDYEIRKKMIESGKVSAILALPDKLFANVSISVQCWVLDKGKNNSNILFINANQLGTLISRKIRVLKQDDLDKIIMVYKDFKAGNEIKQPGFAKTAALEEIKSNDYSLNPGRYVGADESDKMSQEEIQEELRKTTAELLELMKEGKELEDKVKEILEKELR
ncbi:type I restriction enzyme M protein [Metamycoplasma subdolum]|uniref:site-specific DNA-methyltransferase (adenine-specific) n=1 Tax=Metamycoplasma subdolum TaxID=92407 RepID=A0A3M0A817_9BACT|nr:class I SAM-dependent DNA methyltransferase [Metamycoplasma subdolum]RMA78615.1 type I restriction enzyme M protein [Metamycoplasma subdolum]WPB50783.1 class I SAM-dependent DNA methyltransferase [Metamycoplasma subdolum]